MQQGKNGTGFDIALLGIDGIGKTSLSNALAAALREQGHCVTVTSWRDYLRRGTSASGTRVLSSLYTTMFRSLYTACVGPDGNDAHGLLPDLDEDLRQDEGAAVTLNDPAVPVALNTDRPATFLAAGLMEIAARLLERELVIEPALARGEVVIQDSHSLKNAVKLGAFAANVLGDERPVRDYLSFAERCLGQWAPPAISVFVSGDPRLAYRWRRTQNGHIGRGEHLDVGGRPAESTFVELQTAMQRRLAEIAAAERWPRVTMSDRPQQQNVAEAVATVLDVIAEARS